MSILNIKLWTIFCTIFFVAASNAASRNVAHYNLQNGVGFKGHDPVSAFSEGGGVVLKGTAAHRVVFEGVTYYFANHQNAALFEKHPSKYEPTYGGNCAWGMAHGSKVDIVPSLVTIHGNRAHYFVSARAKRQFDTNIQKFEALADGHWRDISGEEPRI